MKHCVISVLLKNCRHFRLLIWISLISQFVHPVGEKRREWGREGWDAQIFILESYKFDFIKIHDNLLQDPSKSIKKC